ncbi:zinc finger protein 646 isoform X2 [Mastacembelus armatus]|uniref:zinc finger protein 646 isoform X2 n=1 Tax=Mastacembelus armatus TaxID=205130 RepID=UPI000E45E624|nr:zinc finger protein 646-like isoform X2 [Mastacembelus armatus]
MAVQDPGRTTGFPCKQCGIVFPSMPSLLEHMDAHLQQEEERKFKCDQCGRGYRHAGSLANHKKTHKVGSFQCNICGKENSNAWALKSHLRSHTSQKKYSCAECGKGFRLASQLATHERVHLARRAKEQSYRKLDMEYLTHEIENDHPHHLNEHSASVGISTENSPAENEMEIVYNAQTETSDDAANRPFRCDLCDKSYIHHRSLTNHKKTHQVGMFECTVCFKLFNNMAALYSHQRTHKARSGTDPGSLGGSYTGTPPDHQFSPRSQNAPVNFCHLCQVLLPNDEEFQEHIQMHNSSSVSFGLQDALLEKHNISYDNSIASPESNFYASPVNNVPSVSSIDSHGGFDQQEVQFRSNSHVYSDCSNNQTPSSNSTQGEPPIIDANVLSPVLMHTQNTDNAAEMEETSTVDSVERPFKCQICSKSYRHSGSLINHKRSHQVGIYQCSVCRKSYPHLAALKSHLRLHKAQPSCFRLNTEGDWLSSEPLTLDNQQGCFSPQEEEEDSAHPVLGIDQENGVDHSNGVLYHEQFNQDFSQDMTVHLPPNEHLMQRHMCADCGETFADIAGIKSHSCPLLQQQHDTTSSDYNSNISFQISNGHSAIGNTGSNVEFHGVNGSHDQSYFEQNFHETVNCDQLNGSREGDNAEEDDDGDLYQCSICGNNYTSMRALRSHLRGHTHSQGVFRCLVCQKRFYNLLALKNHQRSHFDIKRHTCHECGKAFKIQKQLLNHLRRHKENQAKIQELNNQIQALMQMNGTRSDGGMRPLSSNASQASTTAQRCKQLPEGKTEQTKSETLVKSEDTGDQRPFACDQCGRTYRHAGSLVNHRNSHKTGEYYCSVCNNTYSNQLAMKNHLRTHFAYRKHSCQKCGKGFRGKKQLIAHVCADLRKDGATGRRGLKSRPFKCKECKQTFLSVDQLETHTCEGPSGSSDAQTNMSSNKEERPFTCNICNRSYRHAGSLLNHKNTHKTGHFSCTFCSKPFTNPMALRNHTRIHTQKKKYVCLTCGKAFRLASILHNHQKVHNRVASHFRCPACGKSFQGRSGLKRHRCCKGQENSARAGVPQSERGDKCFMCDLCGRSYRHAGSLLNHKKMHSENLHHCTLCLQTFPDPLTLQIHSQMRRHCCPECGKTFCLITHLQSHMEVHSKERAVVCSLCQQSFPDTASYQQHHDMHHRAQDPYQQNVNEPVDNNPCWDSGINQTIGMDRVHKQVPPPLSHIPGSITNSQKSNDAAGTEEKSHVCEHCGRTYRHAGSLLNHKNSHKTGSFFCSICQKEFTNLMALKNHRRIHTEPKRYQCLECGKAFRVSTQLICHRRIHTKEKPFACLLCNKSFSSKSNLRHHQKMHQNTQTYDSSYSMDANTFMDLDMESFL